MWIFTVWTQSSVVDCTVCFVSEQRIAKVNELNSHLEQVISNKQQLMARLQQPFVNDYLPVELQYQRWNFAINSYFVDFSTADAMLCCVVLLPSSFVTLSRYELCSTSCNPRPPDGANWRLRHRHSYDYDVCPPLLLSAPTAPSFSCLLNCDFDLPKMVLPLPPLGHI